MRAPWQPAAVVLVSFTLPAGAVGPKRSREVGPEPVAIVTGYRQARFGVDRSELERLFPDATPYHPAREQAGITSLALDDVYLDRPARVVLELYRDRFYRARVSIDDGAGPDGEDCARASFTEIEAVLVAGHGPGNRPNYVAPGGGETDRPVPGGSAWHAWRAPGCAELSALCWQVLHFLQIGERQPFHAVVFTDPAIARERARGGALPAPEGTE